MEKERKKERKKEKRKKKKKGKKLIRLSLSRINLKNT